MGVTNQDPGCCCSGCETTICTANTCGTGNVATGILVTILSGGTTISSGTTDVTGCVTLPIPAAGSYTVTTSGNARYQNSSSTHTLTCGGTTVITLTTGTGYTCLVCFIQPVPNTLFLTVAGTMYTVTNLNSGPTVTASLSISNLMIPDATKNCSNGSVNPCTGPTSGTLSIPFIFATGGCSVTQQWAACTDCTVVDSSGSPCPTPANSTNYPYFNNVFTTSIYNDQWHGHLFCMGICTVADSSIASWTNKPTPVNITINFPSPGIDGTNPPVLTATLTE